MSGSKLDKALYQKPPFIVGALLSISVVAIFAFTLSAGLTCLVGKLCVSKWAYMIAAPPNELGDTLAGFAGALAFIWIVVTVWLQATELQEQREDIRAQSEATKKMANSMAEQRFEATFFNMLSTFHEIAGNLRYHSTKDRLHEGRKVISIFRGDLESQIDQDLSQGPVTKEDLSAVYEYVWKEYRPILSHYFRYLFNFFRFLDESDVAAPFHSKLLRSQLSDHELTALFYNCLSVSGAKFEEYAVSFALFDNMAEEEVFDKSHVALIDRAAFGDGPLSKVAP